MIEINGIHVGDGLDWLVRMSLKKREYYYSNYCFEDPSKIFWLFQLILELLGPLALVEGLGACFGRRWWGRTVPRAGDPARPSSVCFGIETADHISPW